MGFLRPVRMTKVGILGLKADRERVLALVHDSGAIQVEPLRKEAMALLSPEPGGELQRKVAELLLRYRTLRAALPHRPAQAPRAYRDLNELFAEAERVPVGEEILALKQEEDRLLTERRGLADTAELLERHRYYTDPLGSLRSRRLFAFFGESTPQAYRQLRAEVDRIAEAAFLQGPSNGTIRFLLAVPTEHSDAIGRLAQSSGIRLSAVPLLSGPIAEELPKLTDRRAAVDRRLGEIRARLEAIAQEWYPVVAGLEEALSIENRKFETFGRMGAGERTFALEGWVPERALAGLEGAMLRASGGRAFVYRIPTKEEAPTLMDNPPGIRWYEFFIRFYAIPRASEFDPTWIFAIAFPLFFGFMLGDAGYGLVILGFSLWMIAGFPGGSRVPNAFKSLPKLIMSPSSMRLLAFTLVPGAVLGILLGILYNTWFGTSLPFYSAVFATPLNSVGKLLVVGGYFGLAMVSIGFLLGILKALSHHHPREAVARMGGLLVAWSIAGVGLMLIHQTLTLNGFRILFAHSAAPWTLNAELSLVGIVVVIAGIAMLIASEGFQGVIGGLEVVSHILSYLRLVGILLSSVILAEIVIIGYQGLSGLPTGNFGEHLGLVALGLLLLIAGQIFVLILAVFEPGIQGARLIFVEHFSKYYEGNGRPFQPFGSPRTYTRPASVDDVPPSPVVIGPGT